VTYLIFIFKNITFALGLGIEVTLLFYLIIKGADWIYYRRMKE